jgi:long-chain acyl-CoA synthetase
MNATELFLGHAAPDDSVSVVTEEGQHSYGELRRAVAGVAGFVAQRTRPGDRIGLLAENSFFLAAAYLGILRAGRVAVPLPPSIGIEHCRSIVASTEMRGAFVQPRPTVELASALAPLRFRVLEQAVEGESGPPSELFSSIRDATFDLPPVATDERKQVAAILFTSGSTSQPRGVVLTHRNLIANTRSILEYLRLEPSDRVMVVLPFYYSFGASLLHTHLSVGATLVIDRRFMFPDKVLHRMIETRCTGFAGVPSHYQILLRKSKLASLRFPDLRWMQQAGGKLATPFLAELIRTLPGVRLFVMYGATEATARIAYLPPERLSDKLGSVGKAIPGVTLSLRDENGIEVAPGVVGEVVVEGDNVAQGYWRDPAESAASFKAGRLHTGDLARLDSDGFVYIVDRVKDFIKCGGSRVSTKQLEEVLLAFPDIVEAAVIGMPDDILGEAASAFVVPRDAGDASLEARLLAYANEKLPPHLVPRRIMLLQGLPKSSSGKVQKRELTALL